MQITSMHAYDQAGKPARRIVVQVPATYNFAQILASCTAQAIPMHIGNKAYQWHHHTTQVADAARIKGRTVAIREEVSRAANAAMQGFARQIYATLATSPYHS